nr:MAG TPA: hypothetical protein [Caudoviricetes sp.]
MAQGAFLMHLLKGGETIWTHLKHSLSRYGRPLPRLRAGRRSTASRIGGSQRRILRRSTREKMP